MGDHVTIVLQGPGEGVLSALSVRSAAFGPLFYRQRGQHDAGSYINRNLVWPEGHRHGDIQKEEHSLSKFLTHLVVFL